MVKLNDIVASEELGELVEASNGALEAIGYTDHGIRHVGFVSKLAASILSQLGYDERTVELAAIAGWLHDVGNLVNRVNHGLIGAALVTPILETMGMPTMEVARVVGAIGNHEEEVGSPISEICAAVIIADKVDAHKSRVRKGKYDYRDIHDRVNYSIRENHLTVDKELGIIKYELIMDDTSSIMDFFTIFLKRMLFTENAAKYLGCDFLLYINGVLINTVTPDEYK